MHPLFLIGLGAALVPVLIHLLTRDRIKKVEFSTLRFFAKNSQRVLRRKKYQELLLLLMRMAVCALLAVAFARPFFGAKQDKAKAGQVRRARVIVADVSGSVAQAGGLKEAVERSASELSEGTDAAGLVTFSDSARVDAEVSTKFDTLHARARDIAAGQGGTNIAAGLQTADQLLRNTAAREKEIVLISDLQRSGWAAGVKDWKLAADVQLKVVSLAPAGGVLPHPDLAIVDRYCPETVVLDQTPQTISVKVRNTSGQEMRDVPVTLTVAGKQADSQKVNLKAGGTMLVQFAHVFEAAGDNLMTVHVGTEESQTAENTAWFNARAIGKIPVVILSGGTGQGAGDPAFFLNLALSPKGSPPFDVRTIEASRALPADVAAVVVLSDVDKLKTGMNAALYDLLQRGGGVLFLPGARVSANTFNEQFAAAGGDAASDLAPCRLKSVLETKPVAGEVGGISLGKIEFDHPVFRAFALPHHGDFSTVKFFRWWEVRDYQGAVSGREEERPRVLARFEDGRPALLERPIGRGVSMLLASSTDLRWTNFPEKAAVFQPFVHLTAKYLSIRTEAKTALAVGAELPVVTGAKVKGPDGAVHGEGERVVVGRVGFYTVMGKGGEGEFCYAVNADPAEFDSSTVSAEEIAAAVQRSPEEAAMVAAASQAGAADQDGGRMWWYLAAAVGALFVAELFVANRTLRH